MTPRLRHHIPALPLAWSIAVHLLATAIVGTVAWQIVATAPPREPPTVSFLAPSLGDPPTSADPQPADRRAASAQTTQPKPNTLTPVTDLLASVLATPDAPATPATLPGLVSSVTPSRSPSPFRARDRSGSGAGGDAHATEAGVAPATEPMFPEVSFAGVSGGTAKRIVYVVDASGPMLSSFPVVLEELERSISRLSPSQHVAVVFFRERIASTQGQPPDDLSTTFAPRMMRATEFVRTRMIDWAQQIDCTGRSNPVDGLRRAFEYDPDAVFLLSRSIERSAGGTWGKGEQAILATLDTLNPVQRNGKRPVAIKAIQFLSDDPTGILRRIGQEHGGQDGYTIIARDEQLRSPTRTRGGIGR